MVCDKKQPDRDLVMELYRSGLSTNKIGKQLGFHKSRISKIVKEAGELRFRTLTDAERATAVEKYVADESAPKTAEPVGCDIAGGLFSVKEEWDRTKKELGLFKGRSNLSRFLLEDRYATENLLVRIVLLFVDAGG